ncbi:MAG: hypothetical protein U0625_07135 [Phycisphaerales bacterium]
MTATTPVWRTLRIGGIAKSELLQRLESQGVQLNDAARELFADDRFTVAGAPSVVSTVERSVADLGFPNGATMPQLCEAARGLGFHLCPLELAPHLRLQWLDQPEGQGGQPPTQHRAPPGSVTVVSAPISEDDRVPKGFYLRRIEGVLWLRGYRSDAAHVWSPEDRLLFRDMRGEPAERPSET